MNTNLWFTGGNLTERILRNRGRTREMVAKINADRLKIRLKNFLAGIWKPSTATKRSHIAISLTSWSKRIDDLQLTLLTLIDQNVSPQAIYVWLTPEDIKILPSANRESFEKWGVCFETCPDYRAHKKWLPIILNGRKEPFIVCDDDIIYPREWFGKMIEDDREDAYVGCKCHKISSDTGGFPKPYSEWEKQINHQKDPSKWIFSTGCGGEIIYPKRISSIALDWKAIREICLYNDDIWLKAAHLSANIPVYKTRYSFPCLELPGTDSSGLLANHNGGMNDKQIIATWDYFKISGV